MPDFHWAHRNTIDTMCVRLRVGDVFRVSPREPLGSVATDDASPISATIELIELRVTEPRRGLRGAEPLDDRSKRLISEWTKKYGDMSREDFDWTPF